MNAGPTADQFSRLWAFARGDTPPLEFEVWFLAQRGLEGPLGEELHWDLTSASYKDSEKVWQLRTSLRASLKPFATCECASISDLAAIDMGGEPDADGLMRSQRVFASLNQTIAWGADKYWLYISKCQSCGTVWLIAQEERIYDIFFFQRIGDAELAEARAGRWPERFWTYEDVLSVGRRISRPCRFMDPMAGSLQWTVEDLLIERPAITVREIGNLLGVTERHAEKLVHKVRARMGI